VTNTIFVDRGSAGSQAHVYLESGTDLSGWSHALPGTHDFSSSKKKFFRVQEEAFAEFIDVTGGSVDIDGNTVTVSAFRIGRFEVTQELWDEVYVWALSNGYDFSNMGGGNWSSCVQPAHPANGLNWYDALKWCNARSEKESLAPVYYLDDLLTTVYRTGDDNPEGILPSTVYLDTSADGYRLPTTDEWLYAAHGGQLSQDYSYSGSNTVGDVARYTVNSVDSVCPILAPTFTQGTWPCGSLLPNELGTCDMSGNVREWTQDGLNDTTRFSAGGTYFQDDIFQAITISPNQSPTTSASGQQGLRLALNVPAESIAVSPGKASLRSGQKSSSTRSRKTVK
jgi:hypothetical protein